MLARSVKSRALSKPVLLAQPVAVAAHGDDVAVMEPPGRDRGERWPRAPKPLLIARATRRDMACVGPSVQIFPHASPIRHGLQQALRSPLWG